MVNESRGISPSGSSEIANLLHREGLIDSKMGRTVLFAGLFMEIWINDVRRIASFANSF